MNTAQVIEIRKYDEDAVQIHLRRLTDERQRLKEELRLALELIETLSEENARLRSLR